MQVRLTLEALNARSYRAGELPSYLTDLVVGISRLLKVDWSVVTLVKDGQERILASNLHLEDPDAAYEVHGTLTNVVIETGKPLIINDALQHSELGIPPEGYRAYLGVPLCAPNAQVMGTICSFHRNPRRFSPQDVQIAQLFAERAATAIDNYELYQHQQRLNQTLEYTIAQRTAELHQAQSQLIEQARLAAIGQFAAVIVHEVRNPLSTIKLTLDHYSRLSLTASDQERLFLAQTETERLERLLNEILQYSNLQNLQKSELELNQFLPTVITPFQQTPEAMDRRIDFLPNPDPIWVLADQDRMNQVVINLLRNACEAVSAGERIRCEVFGQADQAGFLIHNGGIVIPAEALSRVMELFYTRKPSGTGLGLPIVKQIITAHKGDVSIRSLDGEGTVVTVTLPRIRSHDTPMQNSAHS